MRKVANRCGCARQSVKTCGGYVDLQIPRLMARRRPLFCHSGLLQEALLAKRHTSFQSVRNHHGKIPFAQVALFSVTG